MPHCRNCDAELPISSNGDGLLIFFTGGQGGQVSPFCPNCGIFQHVLVMPSPELPASALQYRNPLQFKSRLPTEGVPPSLSAHLRIRRDFEKSVGVSPFTPAAFKQFDVEIAPLLNSGRVDSEFVDQFAQFWAQAAAMVKHIQGLMQQSKDCAIKHPQNASIFLKLSTWAVSSVKSAMQNVVNQGTTYFLHQRAMELEFALGQAQMATYRMSAYLRLVKAKNSIASFGSRLEFVHEDGAWLRHVGKEFAERTNSKFWAPNSDKGDAIYQRYLTICAGLSDCLVDEIPLQLLDWEKWLICKSAGINAAQNRLYSILDMRTAINKNPEELEDEINHQSQELRDSAQDELYRYQSKLERDNRRLDAESEEKKRLQLISQLVYEQQIARQMSEGKFGAALVSTFLGTYAGATLEGAVRK